MQRLLSQRTLLRYTHAFQLLLLTRSASSFSSVTSSTSRTFPPCPTSLFAGNSPLDFMSSFEPVQDYNSTLIIGKKESLKDLTPDLLEPLGLENLESPILNEMIKSINEKNGGSSSTLVIANDGDTVHKVSIGGLPNKLSRNNHPMAVHSLTKLAGAAKGNTRIVVLTDDFSVGPLASALAKAFPLFSLKSTPAKKKKVAVTFCDSEGNVITENLETAKVTAEGVQIAAGLVDSHPELITTTQFAKTVAEKVKDLPKVQMKQLIGEELRDYGGLYAVGKAANCPPRMIILEYDGEEGSNDETVALVGKVSEKDILYMFTFIDLIIHYVDVYFRVLYTTLGACHSNLG